MNTPAPMIPNSVLFQAPGQPLPATEQRAVRDAVLASLRRAAAVAEFAIRIEAGDEVRLEGVSGNLAGLGDQLEALLKRTVAGLDAERIGGANVTRLDRSLTLGHARLPYRKALRVANGRGWTLSLGEEIPPAAQATLIRFCGLLPLQVLCLPGQPRPDALAHAGQALLYLLPLAGETVRAEIDESARTVCRVDLRRLLQFVLGLATPAT